MMEDVAVAWTIGTLHNEAMLKPIPSKTPLREIPCDRPY